MFCSAKFVHLVEGRLALFANCGAQRCVWVKTNAQSKPGASLTWAYIVLGFKNNEGPNRVESMFMLGQEEMTVNVFQATTVRRMFRSALNEEVNCFQKPLGLLSHLVEHFTNIGD